MPYPTYTFEVIAYDISEVISEPLPDALENILLGLANRTVWIKTIDLPLKHGDQFTVSGEQASYLKRIYVDVTSPLLRIVVNPPTVTTDDLTMGFGSDADLVGTITDGGSTNVTDYGFVWAEHENPTIADNVESVGTDNFSGEFSTNINSLPYPATIYFAAYATNSGGTSYGEVLSGEVQICLAAGTKITLASGEKKNIEDITYDDDLLVWNFDQKKFDSSKPVWMVKPFEARRYGAIKFSNGAELRTVADGRGHRIFNKDKGMFTFSMNENTPIGTATITSQQETVNVIEKTIVKENTVFYNIITHAHFNMFANDILTSTGLNNLYPIVDMKFVKDKDRKAFDSEEFSDLPKEVVEGLRLSEQPVGYPKLKEKLNLMLSRQS